MHIIHPWICVLYCLDLHSHPVSVMLADDGKLSLIEVRSYIVGLLAQVHEVAICITEDCVVNEFVDGYRELCSLEHLRMDVRQML